MGKPAARTTDIAMTCNDPTDMPTGMVVSVGTVLINNLPAAKKGDQIVGVDIHIIMIPSPGGPVPTPIPHPFMGIIDNGLSSTVKIMGQPAATQDSTATNTPSHIPQGPSFQSPPQNKATIKLGSLNVMIGDGSGSGSGSGSGGGGSGVVQVGSGGTGNVEGHFLNVKFVDKGGKPVSGAGYSIETPDNKEWKGTLSGQIKKAVTQEGDYKISLMSIIKAEWSVKQAAVGDKVKLLAETKGVDTEEDAVLGIFIRDSNFPDKPYKTIKTKLKNNKIEEEWEFMVDDDLLKGQDSQGKKKGYSAPSFYFLVRTAGMVQKSNLLEYKDWMELNIKDKEGKAVANKKYKIYCPNGQVLEGKLDGNGHAKIEDIPPGKVKISIEKN